MSNDITLPDGTYEVRTAAGTSYILELEDGSTDYVTRKPGMARPDGDATEPKRLPHDFERMPLAARPRLEVGEPAVFEVTEDESLARIETAAVMTVCEVSE